MRSAHDTNIITWPAAVVTDTYRVSFLALFFEGMVDEALDLEHLGGAEEGGDPVLVHGHLARVHEVEQQPQVLLPHVAQDHDRVLARVALNIFFVSCVYIFLTVRSLCSLIEMDASFRPIFNVDIKY